MAARSRSPPAKRALDPDPCHSDGDVESSEPSEDDSDKTYYCEVCGELKESVGELVNAVRVGEQNVQSICLDCSYEHLEPDKAVEYVDGPESGWRYCSVCSLHFSPSSDNRFADWRFPGQLLTCTRCREAWTLEGWNRELESWLNSHLEYSGRRVIAGHRLSGQRLEFPVPGRCTRLDLITALELASGERMALWKVLSDDTLIACAADKYNEEEVVVDQELLGRGLTFLKGATNDVSLNLRDGDYSDSGNDELAALISHWSAG